MQAGSEELAEAEVQLTKRAVELDALRKAHLVRLDMTVMISFGEPRMVFDDERSNCAHT